MLISISSVSQCSVCGVCACLNRSPPLYRLRVLDKANKETSYINGPWTDVYLRDRRPVVFTHDPGMLFDPKERGVDVTMNPRGHETWNLGGLGHTTF